MVEIKTLAFRELDAGLLYEALRLRQDVFEVEQGPFYPDLDGVDPAALHVVALSGELLVAYARVYRDTDEGHVKIGRMAVRTSWRGQGMATQVMRQAMHEACRRYGCHEVWIDAQTHALNLYKRLGFVEKSAPFLEAGREHVRMAWTCQ